MKLKFTKRNETLKKNGMKWNVTERVEQNETKNNKNSNKMKCEKDSNKMKC